MLVVVQDIHTGFTIIVLQHVLFFVTVQPGLCPKKLNAVALPGTVTAILCRVELVFLFAVNLYKIKTVLCDMRRMRNRERCDRAS